MPPPKYKTVGLEVFKDGKKSFLVKNGVLYTIRDRESNNNYEEGENWTFERWKGSPVSQEEQQNYKNFMQAKVQRLINLCLDGEEADVMDMINAGIDVNMDNGYGTTPLITAAGQGYAGIVKKLLKAGADVNYATEHGNTALRAATLRNSTPLVKMLINAGADVNLGSKNISTPLGIAAERGNNELVSLFINMGADVHKGAPLIDAVRGRNLSIVNTLLEQGADINEKTSSGSTPLTAASITGDLNIMKRLLEAGADMDSSALIKAAEFGHNNVVKALINAGADKEITEDTGKTPLLKAAMSRISTDGPGVVKTLLEAGANVNASDENGDTALHLTIDLHIMKLLKAAGLDINFKNNKGMTPLFVASKDGHSAKVKALLEAGADRNIAANNGQLPKNVATKGDIIDLFEKYDTNEPEKNLFKILWTGFSKADIDFTNNVFYQVTHPENLVQLFPEESLYSICPVCLKHVRHDNQSCMYMTHSCIEQAGFEGYYHKKLWNAFSYKKTVDNIGQIIPPHRQKRLVEWCTFCGRICREHRHYKLAPLFGADGSIPIPEFAGGGGFYAVSCDSPGIGGGGLPEKITRYRKFRETVLTLNTPEFVAKITFEDAINRLVEATWNAPLDPMANLVATIQEAKAYNAEVSNNRFPLPANLPPVPKYVYASPAYPDASNPDLFPIVTPVATNNVKNSAYSMFVEDENIVQFRHRMANGRVNRHDGPSQQIALNRLMGQIKESSETSAMPEFGMCWQFPLKTYTELLDDPTHTPPKCTARLYPEEVLHAIQHATYTDDAIRDEHMAIYTNYQKLFSEKFGKPVGIAGGKRIRRSRRVKRRNRHRTIKASTKGYLVCSR